MRVNLLETHAVTLFLLFNAWLTLKTYSQCVNGQNNCTMCLDSLQCSVCANGTYLNSTTYDCHACPMGCKQCVSSTNCSSCMPAFTLSGASCECAVWTGMNANSGICEACIDPRCFDCSNNNSRCEGCLYTFGVNQTFGCETCRITHCSVCTQNVNGCTGCQTEYGAVVGMDTCVLCSIANCIGCQQNYQTCYQCTTEYGASNNTCVLCRNTNCLICSFDPNHCTTCKPTPSNGLWNYDCVPCNDSNCIECVANASACTICKPGYTLVSINNTQICKYLCGYSYTQGYQCDNAKGVPYDGCDDYCKVMPDFICIVFDNGSSICMYRGKLKMDIVSINQQKSKNILSLVFKVDPPLYIFKSATQQKLKQIFKFSKPGISISNITYNKDTYQLQILAQYDPNIFNQSQPISIIFTQNPDFQPQSLDILLDPIKNKNQLQIQLVSTVIHSFAIAICALGWLLFLLSALFRQIGGVQAMATLHVCWFAILTLKTKLSQPLQSTAPLTYLTGCNYQLTQSATNSEYPYFAWVGFSEQLANNLVMPALVLAPLLAMLIIYIVLKIKAKISQQQLQARLQTQVRCFVRANDFLFYGAVLSFPYFVFCTQILVQSSNFGNLPSLISTGFAVLLYIAIILYRVKCPSLFSHIQNIFTNTRLGTYFYSANLCTLASTVTLLVWIPSIPVISILPCVFLSVAIWIYKPYAKEPQNYRSIVNLAVMASFIGMKQYFQSRENETAKDVQFYVYLIANVCFLLPIVLLCGFISVFYYYCTEKSASKVDNLEDQKERQIQIGNQNDLNVLRELRIYNKISKKNILIKNKMNDFHNEPSKVSTRAELNIPANSNFAISLSNNLNNKINEEKTNSKNKKINTNVKRNKGGNILLSRAVPDLREIKKTIKQKSLTEKKITKQTIIRKT